MSEIDHWAEAVRCARQAETELTHELAAGTEQATAWIRLGELHVTLAYAPDDAALAGWPGGE